ncbi:MAG: hypothetical protein M1833_004370 [Piccolia ochrophora]|nr:MAG: hypothetical protein M1833_004370 [Piccolia ochrophora]
MARPRTPQSSYYDKHYRQTAALIRARQPYLIRNILTGTAIFGFAIGVYSFTIHAVKQDEFEDVPIPDAPAQPAKTPNVGTTTAAALPVAK